jgi:predicted anti-sigma-YlaC factor YlaD
MKSSTMVAMLLIALGIAALAFGGLASRSRDTVDVGNLHVTTEKSHQVPLPPLAGALAIGVGVILLVMNVKKPISAGARS